MSGMNANVDVVITIINMQVVNSYDMLHVKVRQTDVKEKGSNLFPLNSTKSF